MFFKLYTVQNTRFGDTDTYFYSVSGMVKFSNSQLKVSPKKVISNREPIDCAQKDLSSRLGGSISSCGIKVRFPNTMGCRVCMQSGVLEYCRQYCYYLLHNIPSRKMQCENNQNT